MQVNETLALVESAVEYLNNTGKERILDTVDDSIDSALNVTDG